jgi:hypothetical protein
VGFVSYRKNYVERKLSNNFQTRTRHTDFALVNMLAGHDDELYQGREMMEKMNMNPEGDAISMRAVWKSPAA